MAETLLAAGQKVKVIVRDAAKGAAWSQKGAELAVGELGDLAFLTGALKGATGFFTLLPPNLAVPDIYAYQRSLADTITGAVKASGVPHVVILSSVGADLAEGTGPIKGLHYLENALRAAGVKLTAIRAGYFQENVGNSLAPAKHMGIFPNFTPSADYPMPMIATKDIGALAAESLLEPAAKSEIVDLHGPAYSIRQVAEKLGAALGKQLQIVDIPEAGWVGAMTQAGLPQHAAEVFAEMYKGFGSGAIQPKGDRLVQGKTTLDEVIKGLVG
ncbi:MAG: NmrA family NAD(P)-binding protein [Minicystis sp.]